MDTGKVDVKKRRVLKDDKEGRMLCRMEKKYM